MGTERDYEARLAEMAAETLLAGYEEHWDRFMAVTRRARDHFARRNWHGMMADMGERLELHSGDVDRVIARLRWQIGAPIRRPAFWTATRETFGESVERHPNREPARTFFNSVSRRVLGTVGKSGDTEFDSEEADADGHDENPAIFRRYRHDGETPATVRRILEQRPLDAPFEDLERDAAAVAAEIDARSLEAIDILEPVFYRQKLAYLIGRIHYGKWAMPLVLALRHGAGGVAVDAVLQTQAELSIVFSFTRSHFHVETECPWDLIVFLKSILPLKPVAELYISLGLHKHGKTELYRSLRGHLRRSSEQFEIAPGAPGMVMLVFTLPSYDVVFKVIRDRFPPVKTVTHREVRENYELVFTHDRVGRLVEAQEFEDLELPLARFAPGLLEELKREARKTVKLSGETVVLGHVYVEREVIPLNLYLREAGEREVREAVLAYGDAVKELASANIFPGDFLLKNFGVTRHGRVVFYDYDELCLITDCNFRRIPQARRPEDELEPEPWFKVGPNDIFPEEFPRFLEISGELREVFERQHGDLFDVAFWKDVQDKLRTGTIVDVYPYPRERRLSN